MPTNSSFNNHVSDPIPPILGGPDWKDSRQAIEFENDVENDTGSQTQLVNLKRTMGLMGSISLIVGTMIGSGIFVSPGGVFERSGSVYLGLIIWVLCGILSTFGGIVYIELSSVIPSSGAEYSYILSTFGAIPGFLTSWAQLTLIKPALTTGICLTLAQYLVDPFVDDVEQAKWAVNLVSSIAIIFITYLNCLSTNLANRIQIYTTVAKLVAVAIIVVGGIYNLCVGKTDHLAPDFGSTEKSAGKLASAFYSGLWAYDGWNQLNIVTEEIKDPYKNLPRAIFIGLPLVTICYLLVNISFLTAMSNVELIASSSVATLYGDRVLGVMSWLMPLSVVLSTFGAANGSLFTAARMTYVAGREGHLPDFLSFVDVKRDTPSTSLILNCIISVALTIAFDINGLIDFFSFAAWIFYGATAASMIVLRYTRPDANRPFRAPIWMAVIVILMSAFLVIAPVAQEPQIEYLYSGLFIIGGLIFYVPFVHFKWVLPGMEKFTVLVQKTLLVIPPEGLDEEVLIQSTTQKKK
ncbi:unnamed protein product [Allacma fusca]|uniref:b(0,+)-type amino acid transporter 1 n=1 Tax=Allacma fusca TaxID=39272 RepID=A0A8J2P7J7_9HEXA|nr:unnamed protein product [Allacma fusca]